MLKAGGVLGCALNLAVSTMGSGIVTLPLAFSDAGIFPTFLMFIFVAALTILSIDYIVLCIDKVGVHSYEMINRELLGKFNEDLVRCMVILYNFGTGVGYLVILSDLFEPIQPQITKSIPLLSTTKHTLLVFWFFIILPLSCVPNISSLRVTSLLAISSTVFVSFLIVFRYFFPYPHSIESTNVEGRKIAWFWGSNPLMAIPILMFSFDCQSLVFQIYSSLNVMNRANMLKVSLLSVFFSGSIHLSVGLFGYLGHLGDVRDNILSNFNPSEDILFAIGYLVYIIPVNIAFALIVFPTRDALLLFFYGCGSAEKGYAAIGPGAPGECGPRPDAAARRRHVLVSVSLSVASVAAALAAPGLVAVVALLGGVCSSTLCFTYPALYRMRLHYLGIVQCRSAWEMVAMYGMLTVGIVCGVLGTITAVIDRL